MPFLTAAQQEMAALPVGDPTRLALDYLLQNGVGRANAVPTQDVLDFLAANGQVMSREQFQQTVLNATRRGQVFIGVSRRGLFLIQDRDDAIETRDFYQARIQAEQTHLGNLQQLVVAQGWPAI